MQILFVSDKNFQVDRYTEHLEKQHTIVVYNNGHNVFDVAKQNRPDLILSGIFNQGLDGFQLYWQLKSESALRDIPFIIISNHYQQNAYKNIARILGIDYFYEYPHSPEKIIEIVNQVRKTKSENTLSTPDVLDKDSIIQNLLETIVSKNVKDVELQQKKEMLMQTSKLVTLGELASGIAHELNQPLQVISMAAEFLGIMWDANKEIEKSLLREQIETIVQQIKRASQITDHLRTFGRKSSLKRKPLSIEKPIKGAISLLGEQLRNHAIETTLDLPENLPKVLGDQNSLEQVFVSLFINARDSLDEKEQAGQAGDGWHKKLNISARANAETKKMIIKISNNGVPISSGFQDQIFNPLAAPFNLQEIKSIGLSMSSNIIKELEGEMLIENSKEFVTISVTIPLTDEIHDIP